MYFGGAVQTARKSYVPVSNTSRDQCEILKS